MDAADRNSKPIADLTANQPAAIGHELACPACGSDAKHDRDRHSRSWRCADCGHRFNAGEAL